jgi:hypothetical protein
LLALPVKKEIRKMSYEERAKRVWPLVVFGGYELKTFFQEKKSGFFDKEETLDESKRLEGKDVL